MTLTGAVSESLKEMSTKQLIRLVNEMFQVIRKKFGWNQYSRKLMLPLTRELANRGTSHKQYTAAWQHYVRRTGDRPLPRGGGSVSHTGGWMERLRPRRNR